MEGDLQCNIGQFAESYTTYNYIRVGSKKANYVVPLSDGSFIGLENYFTKQNSLFDAQADETYNYLAEETDQTPRTIHIRGKADTVTAASSGTGVNDDWNEFNSNYVTGAPMDTNTSPQPEPIIGAADQPTVLEPVVEEKEENKESSGLSLKLK